MKNLDLKQVSALCIAQPWVTCIFEHGKNVENIHTNIVKRGTIAIYASTSYKRYRKDDCEKHYGISLEFDDLIKGAIIGFATITDVLIPHQRNVNKKFKKWWQPDFHGLILDNIIQLKNPVPAKPPNGAVKFWYLKGKTLEKCLDQIPKSKLKTFVPWE